MNVECERVGKTKVVALTGDMTGDYNEMMNELGDKFHGLFGNIEKVIGKIKADGSNKLTIDDINHLVTNGKIREFHKVKKIYLN